MGATGVMVVTGIAGVTDVVDVTGVITPPPPPPPPLPLLPPLATGAVVIVMFSMPVTPEAALVAVTVTTPTPVAVSIPLELIVAVPVSDTTDQTIFESVALAGSTLAFICSADPFSKEVAEFAPSTVILIIGMVFTVTVQVSVLLLSVVVTVIIAVPIATGVTTPLLTVATPVLLEPHVTALLVAFEGVTVAVRATVASPSARFRA
jgi:hypothetical protein